MYSILNTPSISKGEGGMFSISIRDCCPEEALES